MAKRNGKRTGKYRSRFEASVGPILEAAGYGYETRTVFYAREPGRYTPDFVFGHTWIEAKGYLTPANRVTLLQVKKDHPSADLRLLFQNAKVKLSPTSKTTYGAWATKHGFRWAEKTVPKAWLGRGAKYAALLD